jgi:GDPmannose 4,6-dehydratase
MPRALIVGAAGQDGSYLTEFLLAKGYEVHGLVRPSQLAAPQRLRAVIGRIALTAGDAADQASLDAAVSASRPDEVYNFASNSFMPTSWDDAVLTGEVTGLGVTRLLESLRRLAPKARFYQSSSSEIFGRAAASPQNEETPLHPRSPYGAAKVYAHHIIENYRERHGLFAASGICFNHESPRRDLAFVTRKITRAAAAISLGQAADVKMGDLTARRDWGFAGDYVDAMWRMLQHETPEDFVVATGETRTVQDFVEAAFGVVGLDWRKHLVLDESLRRPPEAVELRGDPAKARRLLGWKPRVSFAQLVESMVRWDLECLRTGRQDAVGAPWTPPT